MARPRSPNYPNIGLGKAVEHIGPVLAKEHRNKMARLVLAKALGSNSLNGRVLGRIGALRAYGLLDGAGDAMTVSDDAVTLVRAPAGNPDRAAALQRCAFRPPIFAKLHEEWPDLSMPPSLENVKYYLAKEGYTDAAAGKAAKSYLSTIGLVAGQPSAYDFDEDEEEAHDMQPPSNTPERTPPAPLAGATSPSPPVKAGMQRAEHPLPEGVARFEFPTAMSADSYDELETWLQLLLRRAKRSVQAN